MEKKQEEVSITYSAREQKELSELRARFAPGGNGQLADPETVRALDARARHLGTAAGVACGIAGTLVTGLGMSLILVRGLMLPGIPAGVAGLSLVILAYPLCQRVTSAVREKAVRPGDGGR